MRLCFMHLFIKGEIVHLVDTHEGSLITTSILVLEVVLNYFRKKAPCEMFDELLMRLCLGICRIVI